MSGTVPFGKYKGRPVEDMLADADYMGWLGAQPWFREKFSHLSRVPEDELSRTPVHNRIQAMFLDPRYCVAFACCAEPGEVERLKAEVTEQHGRSLQETEQKLAKMREEAAAPKSVAWYGEDYYQKQIPALEAALIEIRADELRVACAAKFEVKGADVVIGLEFRRKGCYYERTGVGPLIEYWGARVEIKPVVADDYPAVLRQMARHNTNFLFVDEYCGEGATQEQFVAMFARSGVRVVFKRAVDTWMEAHP